MSKQKQFVYTTLFSTCSELAIFMYWTRNSMNNLLSYCRLVDARISASEKDLPVYLQAIFYRFCVDTFMFSNMAYRPTVYATGMAALV